MAYTTLTYSYLVVFSMMYFNCMAMPSNNTDYNCHIKAIEHVLTIPMESISCYIMPLITNSLGGRQTHKYLDF